MVKYKQNYLKATGLSEYDTVLCENCGSVANSIHHIILKSQGGSDEYENLIALCQQCHDRAHTKSGCKEFQKQLLEITWKR